MLYLYIYGLIYISVNQIGKIHKFFIVFLVMLISLR